MYDLSPLTQKLKANGTSSQYRNVRCVSVKRDIGLDMRFPKKFKAPLKRYEKANELKCIIFHKGDFKFAEQNREPAPRDCRLYLQTEWGKKEQMLPLMIEYVKSHPEWSLSLQTHKYLDIP